MDFADGSLRNGYDALFVALADDTDETLRQKQVAEAQRTGLAHPQAAAVKQFDDAMVALAVGFRKVDGSFDAVDLLHAENGGEMAGLARTFQKFRRVLFDFAVELQEPVERTDAAQHTGNRTYRYPHVVEGFGVAVQAGDVHLLDAYPFVGAPFHKALHIMVVCFAGVLRQTLFQQDVTFVAFVKFVVVMRHFSEKITVIQCLFLRAKLRQKCLSSKKTQLHSKVV